MPKKGKYVICISVEKADNAGVSADYVTIMFGTKNFYQRCHIFASKYTCAINVFVLLVNRKKTNTCT